MNTLDAGPTQEIVQACRAGFLKCETKNLAHCHCLAIVIIAILSCLNDVPNPVFAALFTPTISIGVLARGVIRASIVSNFWIKSSRNNTVQVQFLRSGQIVRISTDFASTHLE